MTNPYQHSRTEGEFDVPDYAEYVVPGSYAVPGAGTDHAPYTTAPGWAPSLRLAPDDFPDATRLGTVARRTAVPDDGENPVTFWQPIDQDKRTRHSAEYQDADGWEETKEYPGYPAASAGQNRFAPNPRGNPPPEPRPTSRMAPRTYLFTRPFMTGGYKNNRQTLDGVHFSMAAHRRTYDILGMAPVSTRRNTLRIDPAPWDTGMVDVPPDVPAGVTEYAPQDVAYVSRNWRLT